MTSDLGFDASIRRVEEVTLGCRGAGCWVGERPTTKAFCSKSPTAMAR